MSTVSKEFADNVKKNNGFYNGDDEDAPDNPRCIRIIRYDNAFGGIGYGLIFYQRDWDKYSPSEYVRNPVEYWRYQE